MAQFISFYLVAAFLFFVQGPPFVREIKVRRNINWFVERAHVTSVRECLVLCDVICERDTQVCLQHLLSCTVCQLRLAVVRA